METVAHGRSTIPTRQYLKQESFTLDMRKNGFPWVDQAAQWIHAVSIRGGFWDPAGWLGSSWHLSKFELSYDSMKCSSFTWSLWGKLKDILHQCQSFWSEAWLGVPVINISTECLGGYYNSGAVIHDSNADSTGQLLMCFVTSLVMTFIYKLQMETLCQK